MTTDIDLARHTVQALDKILGNPPMPEPTTAELGALAQALGEHYAGGNDGPIRESDAPKWSDVYTAAELSAALSYQAIRQARAGATHVAEELDCAARAIDDMAAKLEVSRATTQRLLAEIQALRDKLTYLGYSDCARSERCLLDAHHAGNCVTNHEEAARIRREDVEADGE